MKEMYKYPLVSFISINYNQLKITEEFLQSRFKITYPNYEVIIVDNGSPSDNPDSLKENFPKIRLIKSQKNLGFAGGNNLGIQAARGKYLFFINNDTEVETNFLEPLVDLLEKDINIGMVSPKIKFYFSKDKNTIQYAGATGINPATGRGSKIGSFEIDKGQYNDVRETALGHGAAMMIPMSVIEKVGLMPDIFFLYYEEHDWCEHIKREAYKIYYLGESTVYHKESMSVGKNSPLKMYYMTRGRLLFTRRNTKGVKKISALLFFLFFSLPKNIFKLFFKGEFRLLWAFLSAFFWHIFHYRIKINPQLIFNSEGERKIINTTTQTKIKFAK